MNPNKKIAIYYIATGKYKTLFSEFLESLINFFPENKKVVKLISDGLEEYKDYEKGKVKVDLCPRINNYPWPIIALYKTWNITENWDDNCDYACYMNSNAIVKVHNKDVFDLNKISFSYHSFNGKNNPYNPWPYININKYSRAYLENGTYEYIQSGFFFGPSNLVKKMCDDVNEMINYDMVRHIFAEWHDESYINKWCVENHELVDKKYIMTVYEKDIDKDRFIYIRDKNNYGIKK